MTFWDFLVDVFWIYILISCLFVFFAIIGDIFRDKGLNGWAKALWIIFLIVVPFFAALVYLIARGRSMAQRSVERASAQRLEADSYIRSVATSSPVGDIDQAKKLLDAGTITPAEFETLKSKALASA
ncbi:hypothetical protein [uncultured Microbacterium sp.]|uniref:hypothetical protein n=1 Tax=uncultured Microbacterium sp. TaxID=191216 RepID=UPI0035CA48E7